MMVLIILLWLNKLAKFLKVLSLKFATESQILSSKIFLAKVAMKIAQKKYLWLILSYYPEQDSHIRDKFKAVFELSNYATK